MPSCFGFPYQLGHQRALSRVPCSIQLVLISYLLYTYWRIYVNPSLRIHYSLPIPFLSWCLYICSLCLCLYFCFANKFISAIFLDSTYMHCYSICFSLSDLLHSVCTILCKGLEHLRILVSMEVLKSISQKSKG